jgi:hypothetical protein
VVGLWFSGRCEHAGRPSALEPFREAECAGLSSRCGRVRAERLSSTMMPFERHNEMTTKGDFLLGLVATGTNGETQHALLNEFFAGYPIDRLGLLLTSELDAAAKAGAWIASELGVSAAPLLDELVKLLRHPSRDVRFFATDGVLLIAGEDRGQAIAMAVSLIDDTDESVRWRVMKSLVRADPEQLVASLPHLSNTDLGVMLHEALLGEESRIGNRIAATEREQRFAAVEAGRMALAGHVSILHRVANEACHEVREFATDLIEHIAVAPTSQDDIGKRR